MSILLYRLRKRGGLLLKILIGLVIASLPVLLLLQRIDFVRLGVAPLITFKTYKTLGTRKEKMRRGEVWFKIWAYRNALYVYTDMVFGYTPDRIKRYEWGQVPMKDSELPKTDLMLYRIGVCLSELNQRREAMAICNQFEDNFPDSPYIQAVRKLYQELVARQL